MIANIFSGECLISVDVECSGPVPGRYSMLTLGACLVEDVEKQFYVELKPINEHSNPDAMRVVGRDFAEFCDTGLPAKDALLGFRAWIDDVSIGRSPVFVGFNAPFDWSFINWYFHEFLSDNPFGPSGLDIKAYYCGIAGTNWSETRSSSIKKRLGLPDTHEHHALADAVEQALLFVAIIERRAEIAVP